MLRCFWFTALIHYLVRWQLQEFAGRFMLPHLVFQDQLVSLLVSQQTTTFTNLKIQQIHWFRPKAGFLICAFGGWAVIYLLRSWDECLWRLGGFVFLKITLKRELRSI